MSKPNYLGILTRAPRSRADMLKFLSGHFRYNTMNSWNQSTSYAHNVKVHHLDGVDHETKSRMFDLIEVRGSFSDSGFNRRLREFDQAHHHQWQIGSNGRSSGYLVLYQGGTKPSGYQSYCDECGQQNCTWVAPLQPPEDLKEALIWAFHRAGEANTWAMVKEDKGEWSSSMNYDEVFPIIKRAKDAGWDDAKIIQFMQEQVYAIRNNTGKRWSFDNRCGRCGSDARVNYEKPDIQVFTYPGKGTDTERDYEEWDTDTLRYRVKLVMEFDRACEEAVARFVEYARTHHAEEVTVSVPEKRMIAVEDKPE